MFSCASFITFGWEVPSLILFGGDVYTLAGLGAYFEKRTGQRVNLTTRKGIQKAVKTANRILEGAVSSYSSPYADVNKYGKWQWAVVPSAQRTLGAIAHNCMGKNYKTSSKNGVKVCYINKTLDVATSTDEFGRREQTYAFYDKPTSWSPSHADARMFQDVAQILKQEFEKGWVVVDEDGQDEVATAIKTAAHDLQEVCKRLEMMGSLVQKGVCTVDVLAPKDCGHRHCKVRVALSRADYLLATSLWGNVGACVHGYHIIYTDSGWGPAFLGADYPYMICVPGYELDLLEDPKVLEWVSCDECNKGYTQLI